MKIGVVSLGSADFGYGINVCVQRLRLAGFEPEHADETNAGEFDILLFSLFWWEHFYDYVRFLAVAQVDPAKRKPLLIVGGVNVTLNPEPIADFFHYAVVGDGEEAIVSLVCALSEGKDPAGIPGVYDPRSTARVQMQNVPEVHAYPAIIGEKQRITRVEIARGCKFCCKFCAVSHIKPYREVPFSAVCQAIKTAPSKSVAAFAPDRAGYSRFKDLVEFFDSVHKTDIASDFTLEAIDGFDKVGRVRFGIEGMSERLRHAVGKRRTDDRICELMAKLVATASRTNDKHTTCDAYFILDLPGERPEDYEGLARLLDKMGDVLFPEFVFAPIANIFNPNPQTALQWARINLDDTISTRWQAIFQGENRHRYKFKIGAKNPGDSPANRVRAQLSLRGTRRAGKLIWNLVCNPKMSALRKGRDIGTAKKILSFADGVGMPSSYLVGELDVSAPLPWDFIDNPTSPKEQLIHEWDQYRRIADAS